MKKDPDAKVRAFSVFAIKQMGKEMKAHIPELIDVVKGDKNEEVRCVAADTLGQFGTLAKAAVPALSDALADSDVGPHAAAAARQDGRRGEGGRPRGWSRYNQKPAIRSHAAAAAGAIGLPSITRPDEGGYEGRERGRARRSGPGGRASSAKMTHRAPPSSRRSPTRSRTCGLNAVSVIGKIGVEAKAAVKPLGDILAKDKSTGRAHPGGAQVLAKFGRGRQAGAGDPRGGREGQEREGQGRRRRRAGGGETEAEEVRRRFGSPGRVNAPLASHHGRTTPRPS